MINKPIYSPSGRAEEYAKDRNGNLAVNIYNGCSHGCTYCYAKKFNDRYNKGDFSKVEPRAEIVESVKRQLLREQIKGKTIFLCFMCDPFPMGCDHEPTYQVIQAIKESGNHVRILTKGNTDMNRLLYMLDENDYFGVTISCHEDLSSRIEPNALNPYKRIALVHKALKGNVKTFVSFEPVYEPNIVYNLISNTNVFDEYKIGKLNHFKSDVNWAEFGKECRRLCELHGRKYMLKYDLLKEMGEV